MLNQEVEVNENKTKNDMKKQCNGSCESCDCKPNEEIENGKNI